MLQVSSSLPNALKTACAELSYCAIARSWSLSTWVNDFMTTLLTTAVTSAFSCPLQGLACIWLGFGHLCPGYCLTLPSLISVYSNWAQIFISLLSCLSPFESHCTPSQADSCHRMWQTILLCTHTDTHTDVNAYNRSSPWEWANSSLSTMSSPQTTKSASLSLSLSLCPTPHLYQLMY